MNFYKHHIGDYAQATSHLSFAEDAAYSRLLRKYYAEEQPIPAEMKAAQRLVGARSREEKEAVETVLGEFFVLEADGWHNKRADEEIAKANAQADTNRRIAEEREARKRARNEQRTEHESLNEPLNESSTNRSTKRQPSQTPDTRHHKEQEQKQEQASPRGSRLPADWQLPDDWRAWAEAERPGVLVSEEAAKFADYWHGVAGAKGRKADWLGTWRNWIRNARAVSNPRAGPNAQPLSKTAQAFLTLEGMKSESDLDTRRNPAGTAKAPLALVGSNAGK